MASEIEKVFVISSDVTFRKGLTQLLNNAKSIKAFHCDFDCDAEAVMKVVKDSSPTVAIIQIHLPDIQELDVIKRLSDKFPDLAVLVFTPEINQLTIVELINSGAKGIILNNVDLKQLQNAISEISENGYFFSPHIITLLKNRPSQASQTTIKLNKDEKHILKEIAAGNIMIETCANGDFTTEQYEKLRDSVIAKTGCTSNAGLAVFSLMTEQQSI